MDTKRVSLKNSITKLFSSKRISCLIALILVVTHFVFKKYNYADFHNVLGWDILAYYLYLPFTFIHGDPGISNVEVINYIFEVYKPSGTFYQAYPLENGNYSPMYTIGFAILYFPFFLIGHLWASLSSYPADGFSYPYQVAISNGVMVYIIAGIFALRKLLLRFFNDGVSSVVLISMLLGTNLFHETVAYAVGPHAMMFAGFAAVLWLTAKWHDNPSMKTAFFLGLIAGLCILARGSGIFTLIIPVLWGIHNKESLIKKYQLIARNYKHLLILILGFMVFPLVQMLYWKYVTGQFIFNTYQVTPGFDWLEPHIQKVFFSYKKGWLLYTPIIGFCLIGTYFLWKRYKKIALGVIAFMLINIYVISAWGTWWQGGSFGARYFVDSYAILALPFGALITEIRHQKIISSIVGFLITLFVFLNLFQTWQFNNFLFDGYSMTKEYYWRVFLKTEVTDEDRKYREIIRDFGPVDHFNNPQDYNHHTEGFLNFDEINTFAVPDFFIDSSYAKSGDYSAKISPEVTYGPTFKIPYEELTSKEHAWIKVDFSYLSEAEIAEAKPVLVIEMNHNYGQYIEKRRNWELKDEPFIKGEWNHFEVDYLTPYPLSPKNDVFKIYIYLQGDKPVFIDDFKVDVYERKW